MKTNKFKKYRFQFIILVLGLIISISTISLTYSSKKVSFEVSSLNEEEAIYKLLDNVADSTPSVVTYEYELPVLEIKPKEIIVASKNEKEDPQKVAANKGVGKEVSAQEAISRYETNETSMGIDVSTWNGNIDWKKVREAGIKFAMIRIGFRGYQSGQIMMDNTFYQNIKGALANNINVGVYFFTAATNEREAQEEAAWVLEVIKNYDISYPIAYDIEIFGNREDTRMRGLSDHQITNNTLAFCNYIRNKGYTPMIYSYLNAFNNKLEVGRFGSNRVWLAHYTDKTNYKGNYHMWQYTSSGSVPGITGRVDMNVSYFSVTNDISKRQVVNGVNSNANDFSLTFKDVRVVASMKEETYLRTTPSLSVPNKAGSISAGSSVIITGISDSFIRISYDDNIYYIDSIKKINLPPTTWKKDYINEAIVLTKDEQLLQEPYYYLFNNVANTIKSGTKLTLIAYNDEYIKVSYEGKEYYIYDNNGCYEKYSAPVVQSDENQENDEDNTIVSDDQNNNLDTQDTNQE